MPKRLYEAMYIVRPDVVDDGLQGVMDRVAATVVQLGGEIDLHEVWDRRDLAYEIDGCLRGTYCIAYFNAEGEAVEGLRRELELDEQVLRHVVVVPNPRAIWRPQAQQESPAEEEVTEASSEVPEEAPTAEAAEVGEDEVPEPVAEEEGPSAEEPADESEE